MNQNEIQPLLLEILRQKEGHFVTPYQICQIIEQSHFDVWTELTRQYPSSPGAPVMGEGAGIPYSPATFVSHALESARKHNASVRKEYFACDGVRFSEIIPGFTGKIVSIWAWHF